LLFRSSQRESAIASPSIFAAAGYGASHGVPE
jgi:hypothetical protein